VLLVSLEVLYNIFLLPQLGIEELRVTLELVGQPLVGIVQEFSLIANSLEEGVEDLSLDVIVMVFTFVVPVVVEHRLNLTLDSLLLLIEVHHDVVVRLLLLGVDALDLLHLGSQRSEVLNFWGELLLSILHFHLNLLHCLRNLLQSLVLLVIQKLFLVRHSLNLLLDVGVSLDASVSFKPLHEAIKVLSPSLQNLFGSLEDSHFRLDLPENLLHLLVLIVLTSQISSVLSKVISLHVLPTLGFGVLTLFVRHGSFKGLLFELKLLNFSVLLLLLLGQHGSLRLENAEVVILRGALLDFIFQCHAIFLESLNVTGQSFKFTLGGHWLLEKQLNSLKSLPFVIEFSSQNFIVQLSVLSSFVSEILKHLVRTEVLACYFFSVNQSLLHCQDLGFVELDHVAQLALFFVQLGILLLLFSQL